MQSINEIYAKQVRDGVHIVDLTSLNTDKVTMGLYMDMFLYHKVQESARGKLSVAEKKERRHQKGLAKKADGDRIYSGLVAITDR
jgi:hypothetical protein